MAGVALNGMGRIREVEDRKPVQQKVAVIDAGLAANINHHSSRLEFPVGLRKFAGCNGAIVDDVVIGAGFLDAFSGKSERRRGGQNGAATVKSHSRGGRYVIERAGFRDHIVGAMARPEVVVRRPAINSEISYGNGLP